MDEKFSRSTALLGSEVMEALRTKRVIIFGVGGVGSVAAEALIRTGLMHLTMVDDDDVQESNINRQIQAIPTAIGQPKVEALKEKLMQINPEAEIVTRCERVNEDWLKQNGLEGFDYVIDAIDSVGDKTDLIIYASRARGCKVFSSMGAALRFDPTQIRVAELFDVKGDALAKAVRERMKKIGMKPRKKIKCVYSMEQSQKPKVESTEPIKGSLMQVTAVFGCTLASLVIEDIRKS